MMTSARSQRGYINQQTYQRDFVYPTENPHEGNQGRNLQHNNQPISETISSRSEEARKHRLGTRLPQTTIDLDNGTYKILNRVQINKRGALEDSITNQNDRVVFPGPTSKGSSYKLEIPEECKRKGYCEHVPGYPTEYVQKLVAELGDAVKSFPRDTLDEGVQIAQRLGGPGTDQEIELCNYTEQILHPQSAPDKENKWYTVLNLPEKPLQGFRAEVCNNENSSCSPIATIQDGYSGSCKQKYVFRTAEVIDDNGKHVQKYVRLPSCCSCVITVVKGNPFIKK